MKRVCLIHGVGKHTNLSDVCVFGERLKKALGMEYTAYHWQHPGMNPPDPRPTNYLFGSIRDFTWEVIMDFTYAVREFDAHVSALPEADLYVGHSAGGVLAMARPDAPCAIMGCPLQLLAQQKPKLLSMRATSGMDLLSVIHNRDAIAAPMLAGTNVYYDNGRWALDEFINPIAAHTQYWQSENSVQIVIDWYKRMGS